MFIIIYYSVSLARLAEVGLSCFVQTDEVSARLSIMKEDVINNADKDSLKVVTTNEGSSNTLSTA